MEFLDLAFPLRKDKNVILNVFKKNEWKQYLFKKNYIIIFIRITIQYNNHIFF